MRNALIKATIAKSSCQTSPSTSHLPGLDALLRDAASAIFHVHTMWFTIHWDRAEPAADTVEVNPASLSVNGAMQTPQIRVSRAAPLTSGTVCPTVRTTLRCCSTVSPKPQDTRPWNSSFSLHGKIWRMQCSAIHRAGLAPCGSGTRNPDSTAQILRAACASGGVISN